eukprot:Nitzschia sp. Nitz4//scaffold35_size145790//7730//8227//NITZ4_003002-RA/size145790-processed-gene-0.38-mRNA-1//1//CDS//3329549040//797//frame0
MSSARPDTFRYFTEPANIESKCIFCKIGDGRIKPGKPDEPGELVMEGERVVAFNDIAPGASRHHFLVITKEHVKNCWGLTPSLLDEIEGTADKLLEKYNIDGEETRKFFIRPPWNSVYHVHMHVMIGELTDSAWNPRKIGYQSPWFHVTPLELRNYWKETGVSEK